MHRDQHVLARVHTERLAKALQARGTEPARVLAREEGAEHTSDHGPCRSSPPNWNEPPDRISAMSFGSS